MWKPIRRGGIVRLTIFVVAVMVIFVGIPVWQAYADCYRPEYLAEGWVLGVIRAYEDIINRTADAFTAHAGSTAKPPCQPAPGGKTSPTIPPTDPCAPATPSDQCGYYDIWNPNGPDVRWPAATAAAGIHYYIDVSDPGLSGSIASSFATWQSASNGKIKFFPDAFGPITSNPLSFSDGVNSVSFGPVSAAELTEGWYQDVNGRTGYLSFHFDGANNVPTAGTIAWASSFTGLIYEADTVLNSNLSWDYQLPLPANTYYVPNTMVHEAGHWLDLADLYGDGYRELTMYFQTNIGETKYATLGAGDIQGVRAIYP